MKTTAAQALAFMHFFQWFSFKGNYIAHNFAYSTNSSFTNNTS